MNYANLSAEEKLDFTRGVMNMLSEWPVDSAGLILLLGMPSDTRSRIARKLGEDTAFPDDANVIKHIEHLLGIGDALRTTYPRTPQMGARWLGNPCRQLSGKRPIAIMTEGGLGGILRVRRHLDCSFAWDESGSQR